MDEVKTTEDMPPPYAVRWAMGEYPPGRLDFTTWHETRNGWMTLCGRPVRHDAPHVETGEPSQRNCGQCKRRL